MKKTIPQTASDNSSKQIMDNSQPETQSSKPNFTEGVHFYFENGLMVLTERFLRERGYCCGNGCRHCPY